MSYVEKLHVVYRRSYIEPATYDIPYTLYRLSLLASSEKTG